MGGRRSRTRTARKRGRYVGALPAPRDTSDLAFDATLRAAAPFQSERGQAAAAQGAGVQGTGVQGAGAKSTGVQVISEQSPVRSPAFHIRPGDYHKKVRERRAANLIVFVVDASWSMAVSERMEATKGAILSLLTDAYQRRDRVGMIVFQKDRATLVLPPTNSVDLARKMLVHLPVGGKTPLAAGLWLAHQTVEREVRRYPELRPLLVVLTDGAGNVSMGDLPPQEEAYHIAEQIHESDIRAIVINMENAEFDRGLTQALADHLGGPCYNSVALHAEALLGMVRGELLSR
ncbi:MAG: VWA domain-containing protein [Anaerolineae bacterium]|nr:VWA domain-containing protein [Anaerolineae bacterium]